MYSTKEERLNTVNKVSPTDIVFWMSIGKARKDYEKNVCHGYYEPTTEKFIKWLEETWGVRIYISSDNYNIAGDRFDIIAQDKYTMFMLKYS